MRAVVARKQVGAIVEPGVSFAVTSLSLERIALRHPLVDVEWLSKTMALALDGVVEDFEDM